ncbi:MAG: 1-phosphofructokinase family hexose kinase [Clostridia bacterium]|nr:1-phosphofructokinase family hexose kinase [Clostridia bacterium]
MKIFTITLNPAFDVHLGIERLKLHTENYAYSVAKHAGGKGVNISRALKSFGIENMPFLVLGKSGGAEFLDLLKKDGLLCRTIMTDGMVRENITLHASDGETRISTEGCEISETIFEELFGSIKNECNENTIVTFTGRLPKGISKEKAAEFLLKIREFGLKVVVDCNSFSKDELFRIKPFLIKPNEQEIAQLTGKKAENTEDALKLAEELCEKGIENVIVSLGEQGFSYCNKNHKFIISVPKVEVISTIGAGDSLIAGFVAGMIKGFGVEETLRLAAAFGTAACRTVGTNPPQRKEIDKIFERVICQKV